ncbi:hypothetical protein Pcinc_005919 [Petrolisthes cinctipes]|uniref:Uncharacterized protein n=1 Tax=Petrolisthes cinctipes TaxID=88211 RepID=A0AAE1GCJ3_PETCI|nr:hypothetical protein Pcinc_005919 [Petrolisthes cinctipes]
MLKFMKHQQKLTPERIQKQKELFAFNKACYHGFPAKPSALAWDPQLRLLAIATKSGQIRIICSAFVLSASFILTRSIPPNLPPGVFPLLVPPRVSPPPPNCPLTPCLPPLLTAVPQSSLPPL